MAKGNELSVNPSDIRGIGGEVAQIRKARLEQLAVPAKRLARELAGKPGIVGRSILSIYSVIRRFDAARKANGL